LYRQLKISLIKNGGFVFTFILLIIIYISFISLGMQDSLHGTAWPSMYYLFNVPKHYLGFLSMIGSAGTVIASVFSVHVIKRFGTRAIVILSVLLTAISLTIFSYSNSFIILCLLAIPLGLGGGSLDAALNNYVSLHYKARYMNWLHCFWGIGAFFGSLIVSSFLLYRNSWSLSYRTIGIVQFCIVILLLISLPLWDKNKSKENIVQHKTAGFKELFKIVGVKEVLLIFFCYCAIEIIAGIWGASYLVEVKGVSEDIAARWISFYYFGITSGRFISGFITMKLTNRQMIRLGQLIIGCGIITVVLPFEVCAFLGLFMIGLGCAPIFPSLLHETPNNFGKEYSHAIIGIQMGSAYIGTSIMPPIFGWLASLLSFKIFPVFIGTVLVIKIIMVGVLYRKLDKAKV